MNRPESPAWPLIVLGSICLMGCSAAVETVMFGAESLLPDDPRTHFSRAINFAPGDGEVVGLNPPRFRWRYHPTVPGEGGDYAFTFQVATDKAFRRKVLDIETEINFYNTIPPFKGSGPFYWRIGYRERPAGGPPQHWSRVRRFTIAKDAEVWDRSSLAKPDFTGKSHPRILFNRKTLPRLRELVKTDPDTRLIFNKLRSAADKAVASKWWNQIPKSDKKKADQSYLRMAHDLMLVAFCWRITGDKKYASVKERAVRMARYPRGGRASPEAAGGESHEDSTQITEFLGLLYDWLYQDLAEQERKDFLHSLDWRIDFFVNEFAWRRPKGKSKPFVRKGSLATIGASHSFEGFFDTFPAALACYEESAHARQCFEIGVNFMAGVGSSHGFDEGWNEGPGYGNSKLAWEVYAMSYLDSVFPEFNAGRNPWLRRLGQFFRLQTPVGLQHAPWGHGSNNRGYYETGHRKSYRKLAFLTGDGRYLANFKRYGSVKRSLRRPWIECALPIWREKPKPIVEEDATVLFPRAGWVMVMSGPPTDPKTYREGVGMIFCCRPRGSYSHAFCSDNSFHLFGYGQDLSHGAGTGAYEPHAYHSMSHNTILVDGLGQAQPRGHQKTPWFSRITAYRETPNAVYWCGDATLAYPHERFRPREWWGKLSDIYEKRDLAHVTRVNRHVLFIRKRYFVILDDLAASRPSQWSWLYHVLRADEMKLDDATGSFRYRMGDVQVQVTHLAGAGQLDVSNRKSAQGFKNPLTGEDYTRDRGRARGRRKMVARHNLWITTKEKHRTWRFIAVIYPAPKGRALPVVKAVDELTLTVSVDGRTDTISFDPKRAGTADFVVDLGKIAPAGLH